MSGHGKQIELELFCNLTESELRSRGMMLVETVTAIDETNSARSHAMKEFKERLTGFAERQRELSKIIRDQAEKRMVRCMALFHVPAEGTKRIVRLDTGEIVREEAMTGAELQLNIWDSASEFERYMRGQDVGKQESAREPDGDSTAIPLDRPSEEDDTSDSLPS